MSAVIELASIVPTQAGLRDPNKVYDLADWLRGDEACNFDHWQVQLTRFEDGRLFVHNGHHRLVSAALAERHSLPHSSFTIEDWTYARYDEINWHVNYLTPFDPRTETRVADFIPFKHAVAFVEARAGRDAAEAFIRRNPHLYKRPRCVATFIELAALASGSRLDKLFAV